MEMSKSIMGELNSKFHSRGGVSFVSKVNGTKLNTLFQDKNMCTKYIKIEIKIYSKITRHVAINKTMGATSGAGTAYLQVHLGSTPVFSGVRGIQSFMCIFCRSSFVRLSTRLVPCVEEELLPPRSTRVHPRYLLWFVLLCL